MTRSRLLASALAAAVLGANSVGAQSNLRTTTLSDAAVAESLKVIDVLSARIKANPKDAAAHFRLGTVALALMRRAGEPNAPDMPERLTLRSIAGNALWEARALEPDNPEYSAGVAAFYGSVGDRRSNAAHEETLELYRLRGDTAQRIALLIRLGITNWTGPNGYEGGVAIPRVSRIELDPQPTDLLAPVSPNRRAPPAMASNPMQNVEGQWCLPMVPQGIVPASGAQGPPKVECMAASVTAAGGGGLFVPLQNLLAEANNGIRKLDVLIEAFPAERNYLAAKGYFDEAYSLIPQDEAVWRWVNMVRAEKNEFAAIESFARDRIRLAPGDPWGWMALGLARQRAKATVDAKIAFASGLARMTPEERRHLDRLDRVLPPAQRAAFLRGDSAERASASEAAWLLATPLWSGNDEQPRVEFLARLTFAELRWGTLSPRMFGADTHVGDFYVRYGPPNKVLNNFWLYDNGLIFAQAIGHYKIMQRAAADIELNERIKNWQPSRWDNISETKIDSMPVQTARFRAGEDSVDFFLATRAPVASLERVRTLNTTPFANFWLSSWSMPGAFHDSTTFGPSGDMQWRRRVAAGPWYYRVEAVVPGGLAAGRAAATMMMGRDTVTGFALRGFGMSDLLVATQVDGPAVPRRWNDLAVTPLLGSIARGERVSVVWENYDIGRSGAAASYQVTVALGPAYGTTGRPALEILNGAAAALRGRRTSNDFSVQYDRTVPHAPTLVDHVMLSFGDTPPGTYALILTITDRVSGRMTSRTTEIVIRP